MNMVSFSPIATPEVNPQPHTLVLQPQGQLDQDNHADFQAALSQALDTAQTAVIVDFLWVEAIEPQGLKVLQACLNQAVEQGKHLILHRLPTEIRQALVTEQDLQRSSRLGVWTDSCRADFARFLREAARDRYSAPSSLASSSKSFLRHVHDLEPEPTEMPMVAASVAASTEFYAQQTA